MFATPNMIYTLKQKNQVYVLTNEDDVFQSGRENIFMMFLLIHKICHFQ